MNQGHPAPDDWRPLSIEETATLFADAPFRWWISGGRALELHVGRKWRGHRDTDIGIARVNAPLAYRHLDGWDLWVAAAGRLTPWRGDALVAARAENNVWANKCGNHSWSFDLNINSGADEHWVYRRDESVRRPWEEAILKTSRGVPHLAPDIELLFKSESPRPIDDEDARTVIPSLDETQLAFLRSHLSPRHPWRRFMG